MLMNPEKIQYRYLTPSTDPWVHQPIVGGVGKHIHEVVAIINNKYDGYLHDAAAGLDVSFEAIEEALTYYGVNYLEIEKDRHRLRIRNNVMMKLPMKEIEIWLHATLDDGMSPISRLYGNKLDLKILEQYVESISLPSKKKKNRAT